MKETFKYIGIFLLFIVSLIYTDKISGIVKSKDPIMIKIKEVSSNINIKSVDAIIKDDLNIRI